MHRTKIIATLGPAVSSEERMRALVRAGVDVFRLNSAHGTVEEHREMTDRVRKAANEERAVIAVMLDIKGPEIRTSIVRKDALNTGERVSIGPGGDIELSWPEAYSVLKPGVHVLIHDGDMDILIEEIGNLVVGRVIQGGRISPRMGVNIPGESVPMPYIQERDLEFMAELKDVDFIAASFVRNARDLIDLRKEMGRLGCGAQVIAKIENLEGVENIDDILKLSDGIMVARGDLGTEIPVENLPEIQKTLVKKAMYHGKPSIIATQILESMISSPHPTRAEVSDIANAILDGADALMLSEETAMGKHPMEAVKVLIKVAERAEEMVTHRKMEELKGSLSEHVSNAAVLLAREVEADSILLLTRTGKSARLVSRHRTGIPIFAATYSEKVLREMKLLWGVRGFLIDRFEYADEAVRSAMDAAESMGLVKKGDILVIAGGEPSGIPGTTNFVWAQVVGDLIARGTGFGHRKVRGRACSEHGCEILVVEEVTEPIEIGKSKGLIVKSRIYEPSYLRELSERGISIVAGTGDVDIEGEITIDPIRGLVWK